MIYGRFLDLGLFEDLDSSVPSRWGAGRGSRVRPKGAAEELSYSGAG